MGVLVKKQKEVLNLTLIGRLSIVTLIVSLAAGLIDTVWALYLDSFIGSVALVGFFSAFLTVVSFISYFLFIPFIEKTNKGKIYSYTLLLFAITYVLFSINTKFYFFVILALILTLLYTLKITSFGIIVRDKSSEKQLSRNEGLVYTFANIAWAIGPLIAGYVADKYGVNKVFLLAAIFIFIGFIVFKLSGVKDANIKKKTDKKFVKNFFEFFRNKQRILAYFLGGGISIWWVLIYLFMPLYIVRQDLSELWVGYFLFAIVVPLVLFEYVFSKLAGKIGFTKIFKLGYIILALAALACFFVSSVYVIMGLLVLASVGMAMLEPTTEAYFFDLLKGKQQLKYYGPYNTTIDVNNFIGKIVASGFLLFLPFKFIFLVFAGFMLIMFVLVFGLRNIIESKRDGKKN